MRHLFHSVFIIWVSILISVSAAKQQRLSESPPSVTSKAEQALTQKQALGKKLFFDENLSTPIGQSCASCHAAESGFSNPDVDYPVSQGVHKDRFGNRNDLPAAYASFSPPFHYDANESLYVGGQFWDGRAADLAEQAKGPFVNPLEMANPDEKTVVEKVRNSEYAGLFREVFGNDAFEDPNNAGD